MEGTLGEIKMFGGYFAPVNWVFCHGQVLPIEQYQSLFSVLGTIYGGNGRFTFALPDMRGRTVIGAGRGHGLTPRSEGQKGGSEQGEKAQSPTGTGQEVRKDTDNMQPWIATNYIICIEGEFPRRS